MNENVIYNIKIDPDDFIDNALKMSRYPKLASYLSYEHLKKTDQGVGVILMERYAWALVVMKLSIITPITNLNITGKTWYAGRRGPYYRREYSLFQDGKPVLVGASYSILLDVIDRSVYRNKTLPFKELTPTDIFLTDLKTSFKETIDYTFIQTNTVKEQHIDALGHTNHLNYIEFIYQTLDYNEIKEMNTYNTLELFFQKEMLLGDVFTINKGYKDDFLIYLIYNKTRDEMAFTLKLSKESL